MSQSLSKLIPRPYQQKAIDEVRLDFATGNKRTLIQLSTGAGKTFIFSTVMNGAQAKGKRCVMAVRGRSLVAQASKRLQEMDIDHSVFMSNDPRYDKEKLLQICSVDTIRARKYAPPADIVIIDEAHLATSKSFKDFLEFYPDAFWLSVTATPLVKGGLRHLANKIVYPISFAGLVAQGWLCDAKYFVPTEFDTSQIKVVKGEFDDESALVQFEKQSVYGDVVKSFKTKCVGEPTFCFAINVAHAHLIQKYFADNEINTVVITAETSLKEREFLLNALDKLEIACIISVGTMTTGVDLPSLKNIILCRPTQSKNLFIQMLGRGTRTYPGKDHFKVIDMVGNVSRHGFIIDERIASLDGYESKKKLEKSLISLPPIKTCEACFSVVKIHVHTCPECGYVFTKALELPKEINNDLKELDLDLRSRMKFRAKALLLYSWSMGRKVGYVYIKLKDEFGEEACRENWQVYRSCKTEYENWEHGTTPAPCPFASAKNKFVTEY